MQTMHPVLKELICKHQIDDHSLTPSIQALLGELCEQLDSRQQQLDQLSLALSQAASREAQLDRQQRELLFSKAEAVAQVGSYHLDVRTGRWIASPTLLKIFGISAGYPTDVEGWRQLIHPEHREEMLAYFKDSVTGCQRRFDREYRIVRPGDGEIRWLHGLGELEYDENNCAVRMIGTIQDVTERKLAEDALALRNRALECSLSAVVITDTHRRIQYVNEAFIKMAGCASPAELEGTWATDFIPDRRMAQEIATTLREAGTWSGEIEARRRDGTTLIVEMNSTAVKNAEGRVVAYMNSVIDVTRRRSSEQAMVQLKEQLEATLNALPELLFVISGDHRILDYRAPNKDMLYAPPEAFLGKKLQTILPPDVCKIIEGSISEAMTHGLSFGAIYSLNMPDGLRWYELTASRQGPEQAADARILILVREITSRKVAEEELRRSQACLQAAVRVGDIGIFEHDHNRDLLYFSPELKRIYGWPEEEPGSMQLLLESIHPDQRNDVIQRISQSHDPSGDGRFSLNHRIFRSDGSVGWVEVRARTDFEGEGINRRPLRTTGAVLDVTLEHNAVETLRENEERLRLALTASNQGLYDLNVQTGEAIVNAEYALQIGQDPGSFRESHARWEQRMHPDDHARAIEAYRSYMDGSSSDYRVEFRARDGAGQWRWILSVGKIIERDGNGRPLRMIGTHTDITARKLAEQELIRARAELEEKVQERTRELQAAHDSLKASEAWAREIFNHVQTGILVVDSGSGEALDCNLVALDLLGICRDELTGQASRWFEGLGVAQNRASIAPCENTCTFEQQLVRPDGSRIPVLMTSTVTHLGDRQVLLQSFVDITERKQAQTELEQAKQEAERASEAKSQFLAIMSHEIRTPLNGVTGMLHLLRKEGLTPQQTQRVEMAMTSSSTLMHVINDVLDFSKIEAGKLELNPAAGEIRARVADCVKTAAEQARQKKLTWHCSISDDLPGFVITDWGRLSQILGNLLGNAIKFTEVGFINLELKLAGLGDSTARVRFEVSDTGEGIHPESIKLLFKPFSQLSQNSSRKGVGGTGLGLGICKQLTELMGGTIGVESTPGKGSLFWFELPLPVCDGMESSAATEESPQSPPTIDPCDGSSHARILLLEQNEIAQELACEMIRHAGYGCDCADNLDQAIQLANSRRHFLILADSHFDTSGHGSVLDSIHRLGLSKAGEGGNPESTPVVLLIEAAESEKDTCSPPPAASGILKKPLDPEATLRTLQRWCPSPQTATGTADRCCVSTSQAQLEKTT